MNIRTAVALLAAALVTGVVASTPAHAEGWSINLGYTVVRTAPGVHTHIGSWPVPADLVGRECSATSQPSNNESIHPGNDLIIASGGDQIILPGVEDSSQPVSSVGFLTFDTTVTVTLVMGADGVYSAGLGVVFDCRPPTTTEVPPSTTIPTPTTSLPETTPTSLPGSTTSTTQPATTSASPTTTTAPQTSTSTSTSTSEPAPTSTAPASTSTSYPPPVRITTVPETPTPELPATGGNRTAALVALGFFALGALLARLARRLS